MSNSVIEACRREVGVYEEEWFSSSLPVGKMGSQDMLASNNPVKKGRLVVGCVFFLFFPPSSNPTLPRSPQLRPFRELGGGRGVCVCVFVCVERRGGSYWTEWNFSHCLPSCTPPPYCLTPRLPPYFSRDKECPECLASPAISRDRWNSGKAQEEEEEEEQGKFKVIADMIMCMLVLHIYENCLSICPISTSYLNSIAFQEDSFEHFVFNLQSLLY